LNQYDDLVIAAPLAAETSISPKAFIVNRYSRRHASGAIGNLKTPLAVGFENQFRSTRQFHLQI
jgi:hypothetical protein